MKTSMKAQLATLTSVLVIALLMFTNCASSEKFEEQISGKWQRTDTQDIVAINLSNDSKSIVIGEKQYPATIEKVDLGNYLVQLKVKTESGLAETWTLRQVWNNNGSDFTLVFKHNGTQETLVHPKSS